VQTRVKRVLWRRFDEPQDGWLSFAERDRIVRSAVAAYPDSYRPPRRPRLDVRRITYDDWAWQFRVTDPTNFTAAVNTDWLPPPKRARLDVRRIFVDALGWLFTSVPAPFDATTVVAAAMEPDWPRPPRRPGLDVRRVTYDDWAWLFAVTDPANFTAAVNTDWPRPPKRRVLDMLRIWLDDLGWLFTNVPAPFDPGTVPPMGLDWPRTPKRRPLDVQRIWLDDVGWLFAVTDPRQFVAAVGEITGVQTKKRRLLDVREMRDDQAWIFSVLPTDVFEVFKWPGIDVRSWRLWPGRTNWLKWLEWTGPMAWLKGVLDLAEPAPPAAGNVGEKWYASVRRRIRSRRRH